MKKEKPHTDVLQLLYDKTLIKVSAPMVRYSKLQFRSLVRNYNCDLCYTPMILADSFYQSMKARKNEFTTNLLDTPLITQFAANNVNDFINATKAVALYCDGVDLNCGCPQRWAKQMGIGCVMLEKPELISDLIKQCRNQILKPFTVSVKMRILKNIKETIEICRRLDKCGASFLVVHGRTSAQLSGEVDSYNFKLINENVDCPIIVNGGVKNLQECHYLQELTKCKGVMVANGLLTNPMLFSGSEKTEMSCVKNWIDICFNNTISDYEFMEQPFGEDCMIPEKPPYLTFQCFHHHLVFMLEKVLPRSKRRIFNNLQTFSDVLKFLHAEFNLTPNLYDLNGFKNYRLLSLWASDILTEEINVDSYNHNSNPGNYFASKVNTTNENEVDYDLENIFIEN